jgi:hypothetical protein
LAYYHRQNTMSLRSESHMDSKFSCSLRNGETHQSVKTHNRGQKCQDRKS